MSPLNLSLLCSIFLCIYTQSSVCVDIPKYKFVTDNEEFSLKTLGSSKNRNSWFEHIGCIVHDIRLPNSPWIFSVPSDGGIYSFTTSVEYPEDCLDRCEKYSGTQTGAAKYAFFALFESNRCLCAAEFSVTKDNLATEDKCNMKCTANSPTVAPACGSFGYVNAFRIVRKRQENKIHYPKFIECHADVGDVGHDLPFQASHDSDPMKCLVLCRDLQFRYFAMQGGSACFCGNSYGNKVGSLLTPDKCKPCGSNHNFTCGDTKVNSVYEVAVMTNSANDLPTTYSFAGCYELNFAVESHWIDVSRWISPYVAPENCARFCAKHHYLSMVLSNRKFCFCSNASRTTKYALFDETCEPYRCEANPTYVCGSVDIGAAYRINNIPSQDNSNDGHSIYYYRYHGCHADTDDYRSLPTTAGSPGSNIGCFSACISKKSKFFGLQNGGDCYCGDSFPSDVASDTSLCKIPCRNETEMNCGGEKANSVYINSPLRNTDSVPMKYKTIGCYKIADTTKFPVEVRIIESAIGIHSCALACAIQGFKFFGLQEKHHCFCSNNIEPTFAEHKDVKVEDCASFCTYVECYIVLLNQIISHAADGSSTSHVAPDLTDVPVDVIIPSLSSSDASPQKFSSCSQSSTFSDRSCQFAMDGKSSACGYMESSHTYKDGQQWWKGEFKDFVLVEAVKIINRADSGTLHRLVNFKILLDDDVLCHEHSPSETFTEKKFNCSKPEVSKSVKIMMNKEEYLHICEVVPLGQIIGKKSEITKCNQSSTYNDDSTTNGCKLAIDGHSNKCTYGHITHTYGNNGEWWEGQFSASVQLQAVKLYNRFDCCLDRLHDIAITGSDNQVCYNFKLHGGDISYFKSKAFTCYATIQTTIIRIRNNEKNYLSICEVEAYVI